MSEIEERIVPSGAALRVEVTPEVKNRREQRRADEVLIREAAKRDPVIAAVARLLGALEEDTPSRGVPEDRASLNESQEDRNPEQEAIADENPEDQ